ncbi:MAG: PAS domain S-box protein, partial [Nitrospinota bacterium]
FDITERRQAEETLRESEERFRSVTESANDAIISADSDGNIIVWNKGASQIFGHEQEEALGKALTMIIPEKYTSAHLNGFARYLNTGEPVVFGKTVELEGLRKDGGIFPIEFSLSSWTSGKRRFFTAIIRDITERYAAQTALKKLDNAVNQATEGVVITDVEAIIEYINPAYETISGYSKEDVIGKHTRIFKSGKHDGIFYKNLWDTILSGETWRGEIVNKRKSGELYPEGMTISPVMNEQGIITNFIAVKNDITERKELQKKIIQRTEELTEERNKLEEKVDTRTKELRDYLRVVYDAKVHMELANRSKSRFLSSMSHELRTPLNGILGFADLLRGQFFGKLNDKQSEYVDQIEGSGRHLLSLINDLLDTAKIDAGAMALELVECKPKILVNSAVDMIKSESGRKNQTIEVSIDPTLTVVSVDERKTRQIILNLLSNAIKYTNKGGMIYIRTVREDSMFRVEVEDTGIGIEPDQLEKIFAEFHQADHVRDEQLGGTGIGLALTRRLVELHGGEIGVESQPGKGSKFWVTLPLLKAVAKKTEKSKSGEESTAGDIKNRRILVAEDNEMNLEVILEMLSVHENEVAIAKNGLEAVEIAQSFKPDLILMDMQMPIMDGYEATRQLRTTPGFAEVPIIALTASTGVEAIKKQKAAGCTAHLPKPFDLKKLNQIIKSHGKDA